MKHFLSLADATSAELDRIFDLAFELRAQRERGEPNTPLLRHKTLEMIFEKPSLRTRVSFEQAMYELGGDAIKLGHEEIGIGKRESAADIARVLGGMVQGIMARVFEHDKLVELAEHSAVPVVNALSDYSHPVQALADAMTMMDAFGRDLTGRTLAFVGDGNNVARSLAVMCGKIGMNFIIAAPPGYDLDQPFIESVMTSMPRMNFETTHDAHEAVHHADAIYTDTWVSMGQEQEKQQRIETFSPYQVNAALLGAAPDHAIVLHCLPAYRNLEITDEVIDGPRSRVFQQAHNRLHSQKGLLALLMGEKG